MTKQIKDERYHKLVALMPVGRNKDRDTVWLCRCDCGNETKIVSGKWGKTKSCGCLKYRTKHGLSDTPEYATWASMIHRCLKKGTSLYEIYGGRGITVCKEWQGDDGLHAFIKDMGEKPKGSSLDRIDNNGPYNKDNCRWAIWTQQNRNKSDTTAVTCNGQTHCVSRWAEITGIPRTNIYNRLRRGWTPARALGFDN